MSAGTMLEVGGGQSGKKKTLNTFVIESGQFKRIAERELRVNNHDVFTESALTNIKTIAKVIQKTEKKHFLISIFVLVQ